MYKFDINIAYRNEYKLCVYQIIGQVIFIDPEIDKMFIHSVCWSIIASRLIN